MHFAHQSAAHECVSGGGDSLVECIIVIYSAKFGIRIVEVNYRNIFSKICQGTFWREHDKINIGTMFDLFALMG